MMNIKMNLEFSQIKVLPPLALAGGGLKLICISAYEGIPNTYSLSIIEFIERLTTFLLILTYGYSLPLF